MTRELGFSPFGATLGGGIGFDWVCFLGRSGAGYWRKSLLYKGLCWIQACRDWVCFAHKGRFVEFARQFMAAGYRTTGQAENQIAQLNFMRRIAHAKQSGNGKRRHFVLQRLKAGSQITQIKCIDFIAVGIMPAVDENNRVVLDRLGRNPVTKRYEAVVTNRNGGVKENEKTGNEQTVNLWSISREDLYAGRADQWRFEGTLLRFPIQQKSMSNSRKSKDPCRPNNIDAAHPGGAVIDKENGVQHVFIYCGRFATPTGIYRITRTLDTDKLRNAMREL